MPYLVRSTISYTPAPNTYTFEYATFDLDGDGDQDIVFAQAKYPLEDVGNPLIILLNDGVGNFTNGTSTLFPSGAPLTVHPRGTAVADFNGDGRLDLFIADHGYDAQPIPGAQNRLILSSGAHAVVDASDRLPQLSDYSHSTTAGDIDGDGDNDILVMNIFGGSPNQGPLTDPYFLVNDGTGHFVRHDDLLPPLVATRWYERKYTSCLLFDADGDGDFDLFLGGHGVSSPTNFSRILYNDGSGNFSNAVSLDLPAGPWGPDIEGAIAVTSADLNGDGRPDLILTLQKNYQAHYVQLLINQGAAGFVDETPQRMPQSTADDGRAVHSVQAVDFNGDGFIDLIPRNIQYPPVYLNDGTGHFINLPASFLDPLGEGILSVANFRAIEANGDGRMDLIADMGNGTVFLFAQQDSGLSQTGTANADALLGGASDETLLGMGGDDVIFGGAGNDILTGGAGADKMVGGAGIDLFTDTNNNFNGDAIADFALGDRIVITDATPGSSLGWNGSMLSYGSTSLTLTNLHNASIISSAAPGGGVQIAYGGPALIMSAGPSVAGAASAAASERSKTLAANSHFPLWCADSATLSVEPIPIRFADDIFALA